MTEWRVKWTVVRDGSLEVSSGLVPWSWHRLRASGFILPWRSPSEAPGLNGPRLASNLLPLVAMMRTDWGEAVSLPRRVGMSLSSWCVLSMETTGFAGGLAGLGEQRCKEWVWWVSSRSHVEVLTSLLELSLCGRGGVAGGVNLSHQLACFGALQLDAITWEFMWVGRMETAAERGPAPVGPATCLLQVNQGTSRHTFSTTGISGWQS